MTRSILTFQVSPEAQDHPNWELVARVAGSHCFHASTRLREFLLYVCDCALRGAPEEATEQHIGIHVFGRNPGYNSGEDSIVRTQARALRQKLADYFANEGIEEEAILSIPKGQYVPVFELRVKNVDSDIANRAPSAPLPSAVEEIPVPPAPTEAGAGRPHASRLRAPWIWAGFAAVVVAVAATLGVASLAARHDPLERFWSPFLTGNSSLIIYSNAVFVGDSTNGLRYATPANAPDQPLPSNYIDTYTGIGELTSVYDLTRLFDQYHSSFTLKRSLLVTWDEARLKNLIFIGSVAENPSLRMLPTTRDFTLMAGNGYAGIVNHHPAAGEPALYERPERPLTKDYAILALMPGLGADKRMLICSGLTTMGTQAAVEYVAHPETLEPLLARISTANGKIRPFEAVLETSIVGGVPLETHIVSLHLH